MKKLIAVLCMCLSGYAVFAQSNSPFLNKSWTEIMAMAKKENKSIFVEVSSPQQTRIEALRPELNKEVFNDPTIAKILADNFLCVRMDPMDQKAFEPFAYYFTGYSYPCFVMFYSNGQRIGYYPEIPQALKDKPGFTKTLEDAVAFANVKRTNLRQINFQNISFEEAKKKAKAEHKLIFVDAMFKGCHWCMKMAMDTYTLDNVADFYNNNFICLKIDFLVHKDIAAKYHAQGFPSYFYIDGNGKQVYFQQGYTKDAEKFIGYGKTAIAKMNNKG